MKGTTLTLALSLRKEREVFFEAISPLPPLLKRGGTITIHTTQLRFEPFYSPLPKGEVSYSQRCRRIISCQGFRGAP